ncbi:MAG: putative zinc-binding protein [Pseudomonadota bacterium]
MANDCCAPSGNIMLLPCSGGSNVGQLANQAAVELTQESFGKMYCLAGIGAHLGGFVQSAKDVPEVIVIDGCEVGCGKEIMEHAQVPLKNYLVLTGLGIEKNKNFNLQRQDIDQVKKAVKASRQKAEKAPA